MAKKLSGVCPCGFRFTTPHGEDDAVAVMQYHVNRIHKEEYPNGQTRAEAMEHIKRG